MINKKLITGAFLALCSTAALAPSRTNFDKRLQANVNAWLKSSNAQGQKAGFRYDGTHRNGATEEFVLSDETERQAQEAHDKKQKETDEMLCQKIEDELVAQAKTNHEHTGRGAFDEAAFRARHKDDRTNKTGLFDLNNIGMVRPTRTWATHQTRPTKRDQLITQLCNAAAAEAKTAKQRELAQADTATLDGLRKKHFHEKMKEITGTDADADAEKARLQTAYEAKQDDFDDNRIKLNEANKAAENAENAKRDEIDPSAAANKAIAKFIDFTELSRVPLFGSPRALMAHSAAWAVGVRAAQGTSIVDAAKTTGYSLAGTLATALIITLSNYMKSAKTVAAIPVEAHRRDELHDAPIQSESTPYSIANYKSNFILALSLIPYLMGQNPDFVVRTFKAARRLGFKGSMEEMIKTIKAGFTKDGSNKDRAAFLARTFGPLFSAFVLKD